MKIRLSANPHPVTAGIHCEFDGNGECIRTT